MWAEWLVPLFPPPSPTTTTTRVRVEAVVTVSGTSCILCQVRCCRSGSAVSAETTSACRDVVQTPLKDTEVNWLLQQGRPRPCPVLACRTDDHAPGSLVAVHKAT